MEGSVHNGITGIDHPVIAVRDMEAARKTYENLGFTVPPLGSHIEWGTGNWCIMFPEDYLELRGILDPARYTHDLEAFLDEREGLMGVAFATLGAQQSHDLMVANGLHPQAPRGLSRNFDLPEGRVQPRFSLCFPDAAEVPGLMHVVICEHLTPELIRRPEFLVHANGARRVVSMTGVMDEPAGARSAMSAFLGPAAVQEGRDLLRLTLDSGQVIQLMAPEVFALTFGGIGMDPEPGWPYLAAVTLECDDLAKTRAALQENSIAFFEQPEAVLRVPPQETCGVIMDFVPAP